MNLDPRNLPLHSAFFATTAGRVLLFCEFILSSLLTCCVHLHAEERGGIPFWKIQNREVITSPSRNFRIIGSNSLENIELMGWVEDIADRVERAMGIKLPYGADRVVRIIVKYEDSSAPGKVSYEQGLEEGELTQNLYVCNLDKVDAGNANEELCRLLLNGYVLYHKEKATEGEDASRAVTNRVAPAAVPLWLYRGMAQYMFSDLRAGNTETVLGLWKKGQLQPLPEILNPKPDDHQANHYTAICGVVLAWLESLPNKGELFDRTIERLASGEQVTAVWLSGCVPGCSTPSDLDEKWENWLIGQWRVVFRLGVTTPQVIDQLKEQLVLHPGESGVPLSKDVSQRITFKDLVEQRRAPWIPIVTQNKIAALKLLALGRGREFGDVIGLYCDFLEKLDTRKSNERLLELLDKAEKALAALGAAVGEKAPDGSVGK